MKVKVIQEHTGEEMLMAKPNNDTSEDFTIRIPLKMVLHGLLRFIGLM